MQTMKKNSLSTVVLVILAAVLLAGVAACAKRKSSWTRSGGPDVTHSASAERPWLPGALLRRLRSNPDSYEDAIQRDETEDEVAELTPPTATPAPNERGEPTPADIAPTTPAPPSEVHVAEVPRGNTLRSPKSTRLRATDSPGRAQRSLSDARKNVEPNNAPQAQPEAPPQPEAQPRLEAPPPIEATPQPEATPDEPAASADAARTDPAPTENETEPDQFAEPLLMPQIVGDNEPPAVESIVPTPLNPLRQDARGALAGRWNPLRTDRWLSGSESAHGAVLVPRSRTFDEARPVETETRLIERPGSKDSDEEMESAIEDPIDPLAATRPPVELPSVPPTNPLANEPEQELAAAEPVAPSDAGEPGLMETPDRDVARELDPARIAAAPIRPKTAAAPSRRFAPPAPLRESQAPSEFANDVPQEGAAAAAPEEPIEQPTASEPTVMPDAEAPGAAGAESPLETAVESAIDSAADLVSPPVPAPSFLLNDEESHRESDNPFTVVKVFYGTDRESMLVLPSHAILPRWPAIVCAVLAVILLVSILRWPTASRPLLTSAGIAGCLAVAGLLLHMPELVRGYDPSEPPTLMYGNERGDLQLGECEVTIPKSHTEGEIEQPSVWRLELAESGHKHVVLRSIQPRDSGAFFQSVRERVHKSPRKDLFVFIHGYNVSFDMAARRTAQMAHDLEFQGAPIFYSWPSQGGLLRYTVDENNVVWTAPHLKKFLQDLIANSEAEAINVVAHSMGNRALAMTLLELQAELKPTGPIFQEVVLAAPDIDADIFRRDVAPIIARTAKHATLYASSHDHALRASKVVHGYPRAGDSGEELVVVPGIDTIDVSEADLSILGHSYYANSRPIVHDLEMLLCCRRSASQREWLAAAEFEGQRYWIFDVPAATARTATRRTSTH